MKKKTYSEEKMVFTPDKVYFQVDISPGVVVSFSKTRKKGSLCYISIWGDDDIGMQKEFADFDEARKTYNSIGDGITEKALKAMGFVQV